MHTLNNHLVQFFSDESITSFYMEGMRILEFLTVSPDQKVVFQCDYLERLLHDDDLNFTFSYSFLFLVFDLLVVVN